MWYGSPPEYLVIYHLAALVQGVACMYVHVNQHNYAVMQRYP